MFHTRQFSQKVKKERGEKEVTSLEKHLFEKCLHLLLTQNRTLRFVYNTWAKNYSKRGVCGAGGFKDVIVSNPITFSLI